MADYVAAQDSQSHHQSMMDYISRTMDNKEIKEMLRNHMAIQGALGSKSEFAQHNMKNISRMQTLSDYNKIESPIEESMLRRDS